MVINNIVISSPKAINKNEKMAKHPVLNPCYIIGKKDKYEENKDIKYSCLNNNVIISNYKENKKNIDNKMLKEKIKEKAKIAEKLLNDNKISYENEKIMKKLDEFDTRLYKNNYLNGKEREREKEKRKEIKVSFIEKVHLNQNNNYNSNDIKYININNYNEIFSEIKNKEKEKENEKIDNKVIKKQRNNSNSNLVNFKINSSNAMDANNKKKNNFDIRISSEMPDNPKNIIKSNKNKLINPELVDNLFPYSKDLFSNKNSNDPKQYKYVTQDNVKNSNNNYLINDDKSKVKETDNSVINKLHVNNKEIEDLGIQVNNSLIDDIKNFYDVRSDNKCQNKVNNNKNRDKNLNQNIKDNVRVVEVNTSVLMDNLYEKVHFYF